jgi:hypothetical protein
MSSSRPISSPISLGRVEWSFRKATKKNLKNAENQKLQSDTVEILSPFLPVIVIIVVFPEQGTVHRVEVIQHLLDAASPTRLRG